MTRVVQVWKNDGVFPRASSGKPMSNTLTNIQLIPFKIGNDNFDDTIVVKHLRNDKSVGLNMHSHYLHHLAYSPSINHLSTKSRHVTFRHCNDVEMTIKYLNISLFLFFFPINKWIFIAPWAQASGRLGHSYKAASRRPFVVVQAGFRTRHVTTVAFTIARRNANPLSSTCTPTILL